jgi:MYXO-CTERM domain-containing protein
VPYALIVSLALAAEPVAEAGGGIVAYVGDTVELDGSASRDPEEGALTWAWTQVSGPEVTLQGAESATPRFAVTDAGTLRFELVVTDSEGLSSTPDSVTIAVPWQDLPMPEDAGCAHIPAHPGTWWVGLGALAAARRRRRTS